LGLLVGGYLMIWFGVAGLVSLLLLRIRPSLPSHRAVLGGLLAFAALWLGVGLLGQLVWLPWLLIPQRLLLWPLGGLLLLPWFLAAGEVARGAGIPRGLGWWGGLLLLPWFLAAGEVARGAGIPRGLGWWLGHSAVLAGGLSIALRLNPDELGFIIIVLPLLPIVLGLHALAAAPHRGSWPFALSGALFTSWLFLAVFPLQ
jgi:hypothetical protein